MEAANLTQSILPQGFNDVTQIVRAKERAPFLRAEAKGIYAVLIAKIRF
jgi:hypothetical protein